MNNEKTCLIIHPEDDSTTFLDIVYRNIPNKTVVTGGLKKSEVVDLIKSHDRIMMMGHGSPGGLFGVGQFIDDRFNRMCNYIIDESMVPHLKEKEDSVFIWCNADQFVEHYGLKGFYSGMFISEVGEAIYCGLPGTEQDVVDESNFGFVNILSEHINEDTESIYYKVKHRYGLIAEENPVALYNHKRLYQNL
jgi:hypothetical protein